MVLCDGTFSSIFSRLFCTQCAEASLYNSGDTHVVPIKTSPCHLIMRRLYKLRGTIRPGTRALNKQCNGVTPSRYVIVFPNTNIRVYQVQRLQTADYTNVSCRWNWTFEMNLPPPRPPLPQRPSCVIWTRGRGGGAGAMWWLGGVQVS